eukprot:1003334-Amphidinium_carterae.2
MLGVLRGASELLPALVCQTPPLVSHPKEVKASTCTGNVNICTGRAPEAEANGRPSVQDKEMCIPFIQKLDCQP